MPDVWCVICMTSDIRCLRADVWFQMSNIWCQMSDVWCRTSDFRCQMSGIWCHMSDVRRLMCDMYDVRYRCLTAPVWCHMSDVRRVMCDICMMSDVWYVCCGSILSFVQIFFSFVLNRLSYYYHTCTLPYPKTKEGKIWTKDKIEPHVCLMGDAWCVIRAMSDVRRLTSWHATDISHQTSDVLCLMSDVTGLKSDVRQLMSTVSMKSDVCCLRSDV